MADKILHVHDGLLGHVPRAGATATVVGGAPVTIDPDGLRFSGEPLASPDGPILAVGDSFTYGEDVGDMDAWPAQLQKLMGRRVLNGGVTGYGFDQIVLRTEHLAERYKPPVAIVSFIADDIRRTEMRRLWWYDKPWFAIEDDRLVLKGVPVPQRATLPLKVRHGLERVLFELPYFLQHALGYHARTHRAGAGRVIALRLIERLARLQAERQVRIVVMAQYHPQVWIDGAFAAGQRRLTQAILDGASANGLATLDTFQRFATEPNPREFYGAMHLNPRGNRMVASLLAARLPDLLTSR
jgi:lysophospholipase L1-like esterase